MNIIKKIIIIFLFFILIFFIFLLDKNKQMKIEYEYSFDYNNFESDTGGIIIYKKDNINPISYDSINSESFYQEVQKKNLTWEIVNASMTKENIGPIINNKYIKGNLVDPNTKIEIGYWKYDIQEKSLQIFKNNE